MNLDDHLAAIGQSEIVYEGQWGDTIAQVIHHMLALANQNGRPVVSDFNGVQLRAHPGDTHQKVGEPYPSVPLVAAELAELDRQASIEREQKKAAETVRDQKRAALMARLSVPAGIKLDPNGFLDAGDFLYSKVGDMILITPAQLSQLPKGTVLYSFNGNKAVVGTDAIDGETRHGFLSYGFLPLPRDGQELISVLKENAARTGKDYAEYAARSLTHSLEIREFIHHYRAANPKTGDDKIQELMGTVPKKMRPFWQYWLDQSLSH